MVSYGRMEGAHAILATNTTSTAEDMSTDGGESSRLRGLAAAGRVEKTDQADGQALLKSISDIQRAIKLRPWEAASWQSLAQVSL